MKSFNQNDPVPLIDLRRELADPEVGEAVRGAVLRVMESGSYASGPEVPAFEEAFADYVGARHCVGLSSGSDALFLSLTYAREASIHQANAVTTTPVSFWATTEAAMRARMRVDFVDTDAQGMMEPAHGLCLPVHLYGRPLSAKWISNANRIEDCAQSHARYRWPQVDRLKPIAQCYSFYPTKNLGAMGMAGAVVTDDARLDRWLRQMRNHAEAPGRRFVHERASGNWRMDEIQAAVLRAKLPFLDQWNLLRRDIAHRYTEAWGRAPGLKTPKNESNHCYHIYALRVEYGLANAFVTDMGRQGIQFARRYPFPLHLMDPFRNRYQRGDFPNAEALCASVVNPPLFPEMTDPEINRVIEAVLDWSKEHG